MLRGRGRKRGPYSSFEFRDARRVIPVATAYAALKPPASKKRKYGPNTDHEGSADAVDVSLIATPGDTSSECVQDSEALVDLFPLDGLSDVLPQDLPLDVPFEPCEPQQPQDLQQDSLQWEFYHEDAGEGFDVSSVEDILDEECYFDEEQENNVSSIADESLPPEDPGDSSDEECVLAIAPEFNLSVSEKIKVLLLLAAKFRHRLSYTAAECLMRLAGVVSKEFSFSPSRHLLKSAISYYSSSLSEHHICPNCKHYVGKILESFECLHCSTEIDAKLNKKRGNVFLYISVADQIKSLLTYGGLFDQLIKPSLRQKISQGNFEDIFDGKFYKARVGPDSISFNFFVDGAQVRCTSKNSAWPVLLTLNELPIHLRRKHVMMASVWLGKKKPAMNEYLKPFVSECIQLEREGISLKISGVDIKLRVIPLLCVCDSVARPTLRNATQFNGEYGCGLCYHPAFGMRRGRGHCKSYSISQREFPARTHEETQEYARVAEASGTSQRGIKGHSILTDIPNFDIINCLDLDLFHALVNCAKRFTNLWLSKRYSGRPFSVHTRFAEVDRRFLSITANDNISRNPRSLSERSDFRGHEWFSWVVFYSIPVLYKILPNHFLSHWALLVHGIVILMQNSVSKSDTVYAGRFIRQFNSEIDRLYGAEHVTFSTHLLTHLEKSTNNFGQPWTHSAFIFESFIGEIKAAIHGSNGIAHQIIKYMQLRIALRTMKFDLDYAMSDEERDFFKSVMSSSKVLGEPRMVIRDVSFLGDPKSIVLSPNLHQAVSREGFQPVVGREYVMFDRCIFNDEVYQSVNYSRAEKQNNSVVLLKSQQAFEIHSFVVINNVPVALGHYLVRNRTPLCNVVLPHIKVFNEKCEGNLRCVSVLKFDMKLISFSLSISEEECLRLGIINVLKLEMLT